jgi:hypothetical protein
VAWIDSVGVVYRIIFQYQTILNIQKKNLKFLNNITIPIKIGYQNNIIVPYNFEHKEKKVNFKITSQYLEKLFIQNNTTTPN